jgi:hypothetical protein
VVLLVLLVLLGVWLKTAWGLCCCCCCACSCGSHGGGGGCAGCLHSHRGRLCTTQGVSCASRGGGLMQRRHGGVQAGLASVVCSGRGVRQIASVGDSRRRPGHAPSAGATCRCRV